MGFDCDMTSSKKNKIQDRIPQTEKNDTVQIISLKKIYKGVLEKRVAVNNLTFGLKSAQVINDLVLYYIYMITNCKYWYIFKIYSVSDYWV